MSTTNVDREAEFDLVIRGGRIVDGTRMPAYYGDIAGEFRATHTNSTHYFMRKARSIRCRKPASMW
jgi:hypothetical protein